MSVNNFKELEKIETEFMDEPIGRIKNNVVGSLGLFRFVGDIIELFLPKIFNLFVSMSQPKNPNSIDKE